MRFPRLVKAILRALALRDRRDAGEISPHGLRVAKGLLQAKMNLLLHGRCTNPANQRFAKHLRRYRDNLFVFLDRADVEATNYPAEQDIRIAVVNRKTCGGGNRTAKGAQAQSILMSVLQSCRHKGIRVIDIVTSILRLPTTPPSPWSTQSGKQLRPYFSLTRSEEGKTRSRYLSAEQAALARQHVEAGHEFRKQVERYWQACERWGDTQLEASQAASHEAAKKRASKRRSGSKSSPRSKRS